MRDKKSQSALEFMLIAGAVLFFYVAILYALQVNTADQTRANRVSALKEVALAVQGEIEIANSASDGYKRVFFLPNTILNGVDYNAQVAGDVIYVNTTSDALALSISNVTGQLVKGNNTIMKTNGSVYLNQ